MLEETPKKETTLSREVIGWLRAICIGILAGVFLVVFVVQRHDIVGDSMVPSVNNGDVVFAQKISSYFGQFARGDIVLLDGSGMEGYHHEDYLIKRIIGLPGETIKIRDNKVYIKDKDASDFRILEEPYLNSITKTYITDTGLEKGYDEITLKDDEYYCLGDNRPLSNDSRSLGPFSKDRIKGKVFIRVKPFNQIRFY